MICFLLSLYISVFFFFFKQKTAYEMRISDWSSDVCSSDLAICSGRFVPAWQMAANRKSLCGRHRPFHRLTAVMWFRWVHSRAKQMRMHWRRRSETGSLEEMVSGRSALDLIKASWKLGKALSMLQIGRATGREKVGRNGKMQ